MLEGEAKEDEQSSSPGRHTQGSLCAHLRWKTRKVGRQRAALRRLGDLSPQGIERGSEPNLRLANQRLVRADHPALRRRRQNLDAARHSPRRSQTGARPSERRQQQIRLQHFSRNWKAAHHSPVVRRHAASLGVQARLAPRAFPHRTRHGLRRSGRCGAIPLHQRRPVLGGTSRIARPRHRASLAAGSRRHVPAYHRSR